MAKSNEFSVTLMAELAVTAAKNGWQPNHISNLVENSDLMKVLLGMFNGVYEIQPTMFDINTNIKPRDEIGWSIYKHNSIGIIPWNVEIKTRLQDYKNFDFNKRIKSTVSASVWDFLWYERFVKNNRCDQKLVPEDWRYFQPGQKEQPKILFPDTIFENIETKQKLIRILYFEGDWLKAGCVGLETLIKRKVTNYYVPILSL